MGRRAIPYQPPKINDYINLSPTDSVQRFNRENMRKPFYHFVIIPDLQLQTHGERQRMIANTIALYSNIRKPPNRPILDPVGRMSTTINDVKFE